MYWQKLMALQVPRRRIQQHQPSRGRRRILLNCPTSTKVHHSISARPPLRVLCHHWSPTQGEILFAKLGMRFRSHPLMFILVMIHSSPLLGQTYPIFLLLTAIFSLSTTLLPTNTHLHPLLRRQPVRHHQQIPLKTTMRRSTT